MRPVRADSRLSTLFGLSLTLDEEKDFSFKDPILSSLINYFNKRNARNACLPSIITVQSGEEALMKVITLLDQLLQLEHSGKLDPREPILSNVSCPGCHLCLCVRLSGTFPRELSSSRHDQGGIQVPQDNNEWTLSGEVEGRIKQLRQDIIVGAGAFPPRPLLKENQKNNNELKANEGDPQLEQGISPKSGYDYESSYPSNLNIGYVLLLSSGMGTLVEMLEGSRQVLKQLLLSLVTMPEEQALLNVLPFACVFFEIGIPTKFPSQSGNKLVRPIKEEGQLAMILQDIICIVLEPRPWKVGYSPILLVGSIARGSFPSQQRRRLFGFEVPICLLLSLLTLVGGCISLHMDDNFTGGRGFSLIDSFSNLFRSSSPANSKAGLNQPALDSPNPGEPVEPPIIEPYHPLQKDRERLRELNERLSLYTFGCPLPKHISFDILKAQFQTKLKIEEALRSDRVQDASLFEKRHQIRGEIFYPFGKPLSLDTYLDHLSQIENYGTYHSLPYKRVLK
ncbi:hypothetical protein CQW23_15992 [Capsicum baccatum]|uniref:Uncharacterized protein n=1 Tax=Capsicum baccatum TaxID=33114 RepID=A0A2G2WNL5_CAPBA|nr:hypothetical protein CQW23_15992 [Capsicum baccatum]